MTEQRYPIPQQRHRVEEEILRSRFITTVEFAPTVEAARAFIDEMRQEFADASHNCWAYLVGPPASTAQIGMSDDGEPHGTAGRPMFTVLQHSGVGDIVTVVTRYFGGTLLGKGGLVKAYSGGVQYALESLPRMDKVPKCEVWLVIDYSNVTSLQRLLPDYEAEVLGEDYAVDVTFHLQLPLSYAERFQDDVTELTNGQALIEVKENNE
ncbi:YigZ family protein [bacterium]|nr:YigZ family protein [bacterium]